MLNSSAIMNDGHFEIYCAKKLHSTPKLLDLFDKAKAGGECFYDDTCWLYRIKRMILFNKSISKNKSTGQMERIA